WIEHVRFSREGGLMRCNRDVLGKLRNIGKPRRYTSANEQRWVTTESCDFVFYSKTYTCDANANVCFVLKAIITSWTCVNCAHNIGGSATLLRGAEIDLRKNQKSNHGQPF